MAANMAAK